MKSGNLNFLEPSGPLQAFNGTDLPFFLSSTEYFVCPLRSEKLLLVYIFKCQQHYYILQTIKLVF